MLLLGIVERMDSIMKNESDLKAALTNLGNSIAALQASITKIPGSPDLTKDVEIVQSMAQDIDAATTQVNTLVPPVPPDPTPAP